MEQYISNDMDLDIYLERIFLGLRNISHISDMYSKYLQKAFGITSSQLLVLRTLFREDSLSAGEIGRRIFIKPGTITGVVDRLEKKELVSRLRTSKDRRVVNVAITQAGRDLVEAAPVPVQSRLAVNLKKLPVYEVEALTNSLNRLVELMQTDDISTEISKAATETLAF